MDGSDRIRKRHLIRRRGHFTFCPPVCPSVRLSMCRISFPSFSLFAPPTDQPIALRQDTATAYRSCNACRDHPTMDESTRFFSPDIPRPQSALQLEFADEWYLRGRRGGGGNRQTERSQNGDDTTSWTIYGRKVDRTHEWQIATTGTEFPGQNFVTYENNRSNRVKKSNVSNT